MTRASNEDGGPCNCNNLPRYIDNIKRKPQRIFYNCKDMYEELNSRLKSRACKLLLPVSILLCMGFTIHNVTLVLNHPDHRSRRQAPISYPVVQKDPENTEPSGSHTSYTQRRYLQERMKFETPDNETLALFPNSKTYFPPTIEDIRNKYRMLSDDAIFMPESGVVGPNSSVAIMIPFRNRTEHLRYFMTYNIPVLRRQNIRFKVYIIEQTDHGVFNKGRVNNAGFWIAMDDAKAHGFSWDCVVMHDIDLLIMHEGNFYKCMHPVRHMSVHLPTDNYGFDKSNYDELVGGVLSMTPETWKDINGYSCQYWGWGGEDDDMYKRLVFAKNYDISRPRGRLGAYKMISHAPDGGNPVNEQRYYVLHNWRGRRPYDGLAQVKYKVMRRENNFAYEKITVDIGYYGDDMTFYHIQTEKCDNHMLC